MDKKEELVKGGQGRDADDVAESALIIFCSVAIAICVVNAAFIAAVLRIIFG